MDVTIRPATVEDLPEVQRLSQELFLSDSSRDPLLNMEWSFGEHGKATFLSRITEENRFCFVAVVGQEIVGYTTGSVMEIFPWRPVKRIEMENLIVTQKYRGQRIGEKLAQTVFEHGKSIGMERVSVTAYATNDSAIKFYKRVGFIPDGLQLEKIL